MLKLNPQAQPSVIELGQRRRVSHALSEFLDPIEAGCVFVFLVA